MSAAASGGKKSGRGPSCGGKHDSRHKRACGPRVRFDNANPIPRSRGHATGFFYRRGEQSYLITSRHVLYDTHEGSDRLRFNPNSITILIREESDPGKTDTYQIVLYDRGSPVWIEHPDYRVDVVAVPLEFDIRNSGNYSVTELGILRSPMAVGGTIQPNFGDSVVVLGYPTLNTESYYPILRNGLLATPYNKEYDGKPLFLIDANLQDGMSGSPVIWIRHEEEGTHSEIIGIHSGPLDIVHEGTENLHRVWYFETVREIFGDFR